MKPGLLLWIQAILAAWIGGMGIRLLFKRQRPASQVPRPGVLPAAEDCRVLGELLASADSNAVARDKIQARIRHLAADIAALNAEAEGAPSNQETQLGSQTEATDLAAFLAENPYSPVSSRRDAFQAQAWRVVERLEQIRNPCHGDPQ
jgi:transcription elongation GreA/GreB family factor